MPYDSFAETVIVQQQGAAEDQIREERRLDRVLRDRLTDEAVALLGLVG